MGTSKRMLEAAKGTLQKERENYPGRVSLTGARARLPFLGQMPLTEIKR